MPVTPGPALVALNKIDQFDSDTLALAQEEFPQAVLISASARLGLETPSQNLLQSSPAVFWDYSYNTRDQRFRLDYFESSSL